jgi:predicted HTH transcriptional regulator
MIAIMGKDLLRRIRFRERLTPCNYCPLKIKYILSKCGFSNKSWTIAGTYNKDIRYILIICYNTREKIKRLIEVKTKKIMFEEKYSLTADHAGPR